MNYPVPQDWKSIAAIGFSVIGVILTLKMSPEQAKEVLTSLADTCKALHFNVE